MPSLFRFLFVTGTLVATVFAGLYVLATRFEPGPRPTVYRLHDVKASGPMPTPETRPPENAETTGDGEDAEAEATPTASQTE